MKGNNMYQKIKDGLKVAGLTYCLLGNIYGVTEHLVGNTTGHVSSDIYLEKSKPTKLEKTLIDFFDINKEK